MLIGGINMKPDLYILTLDICGIKNIEKPIHLDFYKKTINRDFDPEKYKIKAIYGENGSGKTAIILSVKILQNILLDKNYLYDSDNQNSLVEIINKKTRKGYIECEIYVNIDNDDKEILDYYVAFEVKDDNRLYITEEKLYSKNGNYSKNVYLPVFETKDGTLVKFGDKDIFSFFKEKTQNLLDKQSFLTAVMSIKDIPESMQKIEYVTVLELMVFALSMVVFIDNADNHRNYRLYQKIQNLDENKKDGGVIETLRQIKKEIPMPYREDLFIHKDLYSLYEQKIAKLHLFIRIFKPELLNIEIEKKEHDEYYKCNLKMVYEDYVLDQEFESCGIKKLMDLFVYLDAASSGMITFIDELDSNINDVYLDKIIEYFIYYGKGQLCFTSHNLSPMTVLKKNRNAITFISSINTVHTWTKCGHLSPENAYKNGFIEDSPFNVDASDFIGVLGGANE